MSIDPSFNPTSLLRELFASAIDAAHPRQVLADYLPEDRSGRVIVIGAGKAAAAMAEVVERSWQGEVSGLVVTRYAHGYPTRRIRVLEASHPVPDAAGARAAAALLDVARGAGADDLVLFLVSGGGSSLTTLPAAGLTLDALLAETGGPDQLPADPGASKHRRHRVCLVNSQTNLPKLHSHIRLTYHCFLH